MIGETLGHYRILRKLGSGGMGDVYVAEDVKLGRNVALKVLPPETRASLERQARFEREARAVAALTHPNVLSIFEFGDDRGVSFAVMELLEGETLRDRLDTGPLPPRQALDFARQITAGLSAAHERGIVHRDLKPENIFLTRDGHVKILDFGLAQWEEPEEKLGDEGNESPTRGRFTDPGVVLGTVGYMSPEQVRGLRVDHRSDFFSFGAILYEMLTGRRAFTGDTSADVMSAILRESPPALSLGEAEPSLNIDRIVGRCLEKHAEARFQSASDLAFALQSLSGVHGTSATGTSRVRPRSLLVSAIAMATLLGGLGLWRISNRETTPDATDPRQVVAVLLPENLTGDPANEFLSVGFADSLFTDLASLPDVTVVPPVDVRAEAGPKVRNRGALARSLGASFLVDSTVQRAGKQLRINVRLLSSEGDVVWRNDYAGEMDGIFALQRRVAEDVVQELNLPVRPEDKARFGPDDDTDVDALTEYWRGRTLLERPDLLESVREAVAAFESAIRKDADLAEAHAGLGEAYWALYSQTRDASWADRAIQASERALELAPDQPRVWVTLALVHDGTGEPERALQDLRRAIELQPNGDDVHRALGQVLSSLGDNEEALVAFDRAIELRPRYWRNHHMRGILLYRMGRYQDAKETFETVISLQPHSASGYQALGTVLQVSGDLEGARKSYENALRVAPSRGSYSNLGTIHYWEGRYQEAIRAYQHALELGPRNALYHRNIGDAYWKLGEVGEAKTSYGTAVSLLEQDLEVNPKNVVALCDLAICAMKLGQLGRAEQHIAEALALAPEDPDVLYSRAVVAALAGRARDALSFLQRAVESGASLHLAERDDDLTSVRSLPEYEQWRQTRGQR